MCNLASDRVVNFTIYTFLCVEEYVVVMVFETFSHCITSITCSAAFCRSVAHPGRGGDEFIMIQTTGQLHRPPKSTSMSSLFSPTQLRRSLPTLPGLPASFASGSSHMSSSSQQTGSANPVVRPRVWRVWLRQKL